MAYLTLNLGFDIANPTHTVDGSFKDDDGTTKPPAKRSKVILTSPAPPDHSPDFQFKQADTTLAVNTGDEIWIRVFSDPPVPNLNVRITAVFGRIPSTGPKPQKLRAPFSINGPNNLACRAAFSHRDLLKSDGSLLLGLGAITDPGPSQYGYIVGVTAWQGGIYYTFGHDPDMDVSTSVPESYAADA